jgi:hypothetical protein
MSTPTDPSQTRDAAYWAKPVDKLKVTDTPRGAVNLNVEGKQVVSPLQGFGQLWQKTYRVKLAGAQVTPVEVVAYWKEHLPDLMPADSRFYPSLTGIKPGEVVLINANVPGVPMPVSTGVLILFADEESFAVMTPQGHPESGFNTFSAFVEGGVTFAQIQSLARANDPIFEFGFRFMGGSKQQEKIWHYVLTTLAAQFNVAAQVEMRKVCVDARLQWSQAGNVWHNSIIRTTLDAPVRVTRKVFKR